MRSMRCGRMQICMWCMTVRVRVWRVTEADVDDVDGRVPETDVPDTAERSRAHVESPACLGMHSIHLLLAAITLGVRGAFFDWQADWADASGCVIVSFQLRKAKDEEKIANLCIPILIPLHISHLPSCP